MNKNKAIAILVSMFLLLACVVYIDFYGVDPSGKGSASDIKLGLDLAGGVSITYQVVGEDEIDATDMSDTISKLQKRVETYSTEAIVYQEGEDRINIEIPGAKDASAILRDLGRPGALYFIAETDADGNKNFTSEYAQNEEGSFGVVYTLNKSIDELLADGSILVQGTDVKNAQAGVAESNLGSEFVVQLSMTEEGKDKFAKATENAAKKGERLAIYYDGKIVSAPGVNEAILVGEATISPMESFEAAESLASTVRIGGLRLELEELHSKVVGAQLGVDAIETSILAAIVGVLVIIVLLCAVYRIPGLTASIGLISYVALIVMLLNGFEMTLTLSGIAGIILSIGMAVDANVVIFARIREEIAAGMSVESSIAIGFKKAMSAILDGNITTLIAAGVLYFLGPGSVKGFAQTLALGIALSMFTALVVNKYLLEAFYALGVREKVYYGVAKDRKPLPFVEKNKIFMSIAGVVIACGIGLMVFHQVSGGDALNYSMEFKGGTSTTVLFDEKMTLEEINSEVVPLIEKATGSTVQIQTVQDSNEVIFKTNTLSMEKRDAMNLALKEKFGIDTSKITSETISATVSDEMKKDTLIAVAVALVGMLLYIRIRFSDVRFGFSSILALAHDVLVVLAFYALARVSVGNTFVACILTIVGYSINATIVIFDRIRENMAQMKPKDELQDVVNKSVTQTMSRSIYTSLTTLVMVISLYIFGVTSIREFALPLMVGILCGGFSSVCLAGTMWYKMRVKFPPREKVEYDEP